MCEIASFVCYTLCYALMNQHLGPNYKGGHTTDHDSALNTSVAPADFEASDPFLFCVFGTDLQFNKPADVCFNVCRKE